MERHSDGGEDEIFDLNTEEDDEVFDLSAEDSLAHMEREFEQYATSQRSRKESKSPMRRDHECIDSLLEELSSSDDDEEEEEEECGCASTQCNPSLHRAEEPSR